MFFNIFCSKLGLSYRKYLLLYSWLYLNFIGQSTTTSVLTVYRSCLLFQTMRPANGRFLSLFIFSLTGSMLATVATTAVGNYMIVTAAT